MSSGHLPRKGGKKDESEAEVWFSFFFFLVLFLYQLWLICCFAYLGVFFFRGVYHRRGRGCGHDRGIRRL